MNNLDYVRSPDKFFENPDQVLKCNFLLDEEKKTALKNWKSTSELKQRSSYEGMDGNPVSHLADVVDALRKLD